MSKKKILVLPGPSLKDLKSLHYAIALAERIYGHVFFMELDDKRSEAGKSPEGAAESASTSVDTSHQSGITVSRLVVREDPEKALARLVREMDIDVLVFDADDPRWNETFSKIRSSLPDQIIQVKEKDCVNYLSDYGRTR